MAKSKAAIQRDGEELLDLEKLFDLGEDGDSAAIRYDLTAFEIDAIQKGVISLSTEFSAATPVRSLLLAIKEAKTKEDIAEILKESPVTYMDYSTIYKAIDIIYENKKPCDLMSPFLNKIATQHNYADLCSRALEDDRLDVISFLLLSNKMSATTVNDMAERARRYGKTTGPDGTAEGSAFKMLADRAKALGKPLLKTYER